LVIGNKIYAPINGCYTEILDITNCNDVTSGQIECVTPTTTTTTTQFPWLLLQTGDPIEQQNNNYIIVQK